MDRGREQRIDHRDELTAASRRLRERARVAHVEIYHRLSRTTRLTHALGDGDERVSRRAGSEEGTALRLWCAGERGVRFSAVSGSSPVAIDEAAARALVGPVSDAPDELEYGAPAGDDLDDVLVPDDGALARWLAGARERLHPTVERMWIEAAETLETWVVDGEVLAHRSRARGWALLELEATQNGAGQPLILASRAWNRLDPEGFERLLGGRIAPNARLRSPVPNDTPPILFFPETAATLVLTLVRAGGALGREVAVAPGFRITDAPDDPAALFGGGFDDLGFATSHRTIADGGALALLQGPGHYRRPSFRDVPVAMPAHLVVDPPVSDPPDDRWSVHRLAIHALSAERWVLEIDATSWRRGRPSGVVRGAHVVTGPRELLAGCIAGAGPSLASHRGVQTPGLLFEGLAVRP